jgi:hypothetical protein
MGSQTQILRLTTPKLKYVLGPRSLRMTALFGITFAQNHSSNFDRNIGDRTLVSVGWQQ